MSVQGVEGQPRWWRRNRDLALSAARESRSMAAEVMYELDLLQKDLPALMRAHHDGQASHQRQGRTVSPDTVTREWEQLSERVDPVIAEFLDLDAAYNRDRDYEEHEAAAHQEKFEQVTAKMRQVIPALERFRNAHDDVLQSAHNTTLAAPRILDEAAAFLTQAQQAFAHTKSLGLSDPTVTDTYRQATTKMDEAKAALSRKEWSVAVRLAETAKSLSKDAATRLSALEQQASEVRTGYLSARTRRDALQTQHDRLPPVMSELRRRYTYPSWKHVDDAPKRIDAAMEGVNAGLRSLESALAQDPLDVPAAVLLLRQIRTAASDVDAVLRSATDTLARLDEVSSDPDTLLVQIRRKTVDARRFLAGLPDEKSQRFTYTFDSLATRTERLALLTHERHPDWGSVIAEAAAIEQGLDAMIRTARSV